MQTKRQESRGEGRKRSVEVPIKGLKKSSYLLKLQYLILVKFQLSLKYHRHSSLKPNRKFQLCSAGGFVDISSVKIHTTKAPSQTLSNPHQLYQPRHRSFSFPRPLLPLRHFLAGASVPFLYTCPSNLHHLGNNFVC